MADTSQRIAAHDAAPGPDAETRALLERLHKPRQAEIEALVRGDHADPFALLGPHPVEDGDGAGGLIVRAFLPEAKAATLTDAATGKPLGQMARLRDEGVFSAFLPNTREADYRLRVTWPGATVDLDDPYRFGPILGDLDIHLLAEGNHLRLHEKLGAHRFEMAGAAGTAFAVWAPNARRVSVVGAFNSWDGRRHVMRRRSEAGVWEIFIPGLSPGEPYKYEIKGPNGDLMPLKADPYAFRMEHPPANAAVTHGLPRVQWRDDAWLGERQNRCRLDAPMAVYEVHLSSWMRRDDGTYLSYDELAEKLVPYAKHMGFTHLELLPITEFPFDGSWGYQPLGMYAPTSRHGGPEAFAAFMERCHEEGIGVILDWVPGHFPTDSHGLGLFDGTHLYEHADPRQGFHQDWNTLIYNYGRNEVRNYLLSNALFWLEHYHMDALRVDAVASMLYLDYSRAADQWIPNEYGGRENLEAITFLKRMNELVHGEHPGAFTVAEESTAWPGVSKPTGEGGLGFSYKWNMGWMHDTLSYMAEDPMHRRHHHDKMTFGLVYAFSENFVLPLSHDEVVHGKGSMIGKMPGDDWQRFANLRAYYGFMYGHPGKKLLFMGGEFAQEREWNHDVGLDWHLLDDPRHEGIQRLIRDLNILYRDTPALHERDCEASGFAWVIGDDRDNSVFAWLRQGADPDRPVLCVSNMTPVPHHDYRIGVPVGGRWSEIMNTDADIYGGSGVTNPAGLQADAAPAHGHAHSLSLTLPPLATIVVGPED